MIHIDVVAADIDKDYRPHVELTGSIAATLLGLTSHVNGVTPAASAELLREVALERTAFIEKATALISFTGDGFASHTSESCPFKI